MGLWFTLRPGLLNPGKGTRRPLYRRLGRSRGLSGRVRKISPSPAFQPCTVRPVASQRNDYAMVRGEKNKKATATTNCRRTKYTDPAPSDYRVRVKGRVLKPFTLSRTDQSKCAWNIVRDFFLILSACAQNILKSETQRGLPFLSTTYILPGRSTFRL